MKSAASMHRHTSAVESASAMKAATPASPSAAMAPAVLCESRRRAYAKRQSGD